ncbi:hypothetical protein DL764_008124 [Monosporascus ibericus]|uniref:Uncharacterized protein n=1 Tax=Monosporascus ibericus TaxID=155417 RepID=A0A4Q4T0K5_9PEZI|nr:hypothetical protein DL764_008124 [Monosporascus ibericus]
MPDTSQSATDNYSEKPLLGVQQGGSTIGDCYAEKSLHVKKRELDKQDTDAMERTEETEQTEEPGQQTEEAERATMWNAVKGSPFQGTLK